jgi:hypothetical protein
MPTAQIADYAAAIAAFGIWLAALHAGEPVHESGMEFGALHAWWGRRRLRPNPHEGIDLVGFRSASGASEASIHGMMLRPIEDGECVAVFYDFLGSTAIVRRPPPSDLLWCYAHLQLDPGVRRGAMLGTGDTLGLVAEGSGPGHRSTACPPHLHLSLLHEQCGGFEWSRLDWSTIHDVPQLCFVPLAVVPQRGTSQSRPVTGRPPAPLPMKDDRDEADSLDLEVQPS